MNNASPAQLPPSLGFARALLAQLIAQGMRDIVLCPGSRSAPLAYAAVQAERAGLVRLHVRIDERTAGFLALGLAKGSGVPAAIVTTSGTAVANLHPAVLEAHHSDIPLIVLSADRPHELRGTGANQTTEQFGIYAGATRLAVDCGVPVGAEHELLDARAIGARAFAAAAGVTGKPGPVQLNVGFRDPLAPNAKQLAQLAQEFTQTPRAVEFEPGLSSQWSSRALVSGAVGGRDSLLDPSLRTIIIAGDGALSLAGVLAQAQGWPIIAEPSSGLASHKHTIAAGVNILSSSAPAADAATDAADASTTWRQRAAHLAGSIEQVVVFGHPTLTRPVQRLIGATNVRTIIVPTSGGQWADSSRTADAVLYSLPQELLDLDNPREESQWLEQWRTLHTELDGVLIHGLDQDESLTSPLTPMRAVRSLVAESQAGDTLVFGASSAIRDADSWVTRWPTEVRVFAHRGLAGIDGTISMALGIALGQSGGRTRLVVGDLTFLHDAGALLHGEHEPHGNLDIVVLNDNGGAIFGGLEHAAAGDDTLYERVFGTSHVSDLSALCAGYNVGHITVRSTTELSEFLSQPAAGIRVAEVNFSRPERSEVTAQLTAELG